MADEQIAFRCSSIYSECMPLRGVAPASYFGDYRGSKLSANNSEELVE